MPLKLKEHTVRTVAPSANNSYSARVVGLGRSQVPIANKNSSCLAHTYRHRVLGDQQCKRFDPYYDDLI